ncbi:MAG: CYTH and CHAD domain-containing protein [Caulobacteraceae bacterium]
MQGGRSAREFEIKLEIPAQTVSKVMRLPWLWELASGELTASNMQAVYYDTPDYSLRDRGVTLRVRRVGARRVQTIKAAANGVALPIERDEWEEEIADDDPELKLAGTPLADFRRKKLMRRLQPCFEIHVDRSAFPIQSANSAIELAIDRAHIVGEDSASFCEIELELKRGASSEMARIARRIAGEVPAALSLKTKAERGYALRQREAPHAFHGDAVALEASTRVGEAFQAIGWACLRHFALNKDAVGAGDLQAVHQMRAGIDRLRAAISIFARLLDGPETDAVKTELKWLTAELDPACELDAFLEDTLLPLKCDEAEAAAVTALCDETALRRQIALERAKQGTASDRYRQLELRTALWLIAAEWSDKAALAAAEPSRRVAGFAAKALTAGTKRALKLLGLFPHLTGGRRKRLYRTLLNLNYAIDFFGELFAAPKPSRSEFQRHVGKLLRDAGRLKDFVVLDQLRDEFMASWTKAEAAADLRAAEKAFALGLAIGHQAPDKGARVDAIQKTGRRLACAERFWE